MAALVVCGVVWRMVRPSGLDAEGTRKVLTNVVYYLLLPALVLVVLWNASLGLSSVYVSLVASTGVLGGIALIWFFCRMCNNSAPVIGAMVLAAGFPNATYLGLPVLENLFGEHGRSIAIQYDLFACTPLLLTVGVFSARHFGNERRGVHPFKELLAVPPLWAAVVGVTLNLADVTVTPWVSEWLEMLASGVVPLMLFSLGLSLRWDTWRWSHLPTLIPVVVIQLMLMPLLAWGVGLSLGLSGTTLIAVVLEAAMPSMVLGLVFCDRFGLDTALYAAAVTLTTGLSLITLPLWFGWLG